MVGNAKGYKSVIVMPETQSEEKKDVLRVCGADLRLVPAAPYKDPGNYVRYSERLAAELAKTHDGGVIWANQFDNTANMQGIMAQLVQKSGNRLMAKLMGLFVLLDQAVHLPGLAVT